LSDAKCDYLSRYLSDLITAVPASINHNICRHDRQWPIRPFGSEPTPLQSLHWRFDHNSVTMFQDAILLRNNAECRAVTAIRSALFPSQVAACVRDISLNLRSPR